MDEGTNLRKTRRPIARWASIALFRGSLAQAPRFLDRSQPAAILESACVVAKRRRMGWRRSFRVWNADRAQSSCGRDGAGIWIFPSSLAESWAVRRVLRTGRGRSDLGSPFAPRRLEAGQLSDRYEGRVWR